eukprot:1219892-Prymnesium_polylepis.3
MSHLRCPAQKGGGSLLVHHSRQDCPVSGRENGGEDLTEKPKSVFEEGRCHRIRNAPTGSTHSPATVHAQPLLEGREKAAEDEYNCVSGHGCKRHGDCLGDSLLNPQASCSIAYARRGGELPRLAAQEYLVPKDLACCHVPSDCSPP